MKKIVFALTMLFLVGCTSPQAERQQAIARQQEAQSAAVIAQSNAAIADSKAEVERFQILAQAAKPDYTPIYVFLLVFGVCVATFIYWQGRHAVAQAETMRYMALNQTPAITIQPQMRIPGPVAEAARLRGGYPEWDGDAGRWLIVDDGGRVLARQKMLTGA